MANTIDNTISYAIYRGDNFVYVGTSRECADFLKVDVKTLRHYASPAYKRRVEKRKKSKAAVEVFRLEEDEGDDFDATVCV
jgi:hypothetical protein